MQKAGAFSVRIKTCLARAFLPILNIRLKFTKERFQMKIAVTYENEEVFGHFGHTRQFKLYQVKDGKIISSEIIDTNGSGHGALAGLLKSLGADVLICGGIGQGARLALEEAGIRLFGGVFGSADKAVNDYIEGSLSYDPDARCDHHSKGHGEGHSCSGHDCSEHNCSEHGCSEHSCSEHTCS